MDDGSINRYLLLKIKLFCPWNFRKQPDQPDFNCIALHKTDKMRIENLRPKKPWKSHWDQVSYIFFNSLQHAKRNWKKNCDIAVPVWLSAWVENLNHHILQSNIRPYLSCCYFFYVSRLWYCEHCLFSFVPSYSRHMILLSCFPKNNRK